MSKRTAVAALLFAHFAFSALGSDLAALCADRAAIERVYHEHRTGDKPPFEQAMPRALLEKLVREDARKEAVLARAYGVKITDAIEAAEVQRIDTTTRAPEMLAEIKAALGNDPARFARAMARPIVVERLLRDKFQNDDALHAPQRRQAETARSELLAARTQGADATKLLELLKQSGAAAVTETTWQLSARPEEKAAGGAGAADLAIKQRFGPQAQLLSPSQPGADRDRKLYFADLPEELQNVLRAQLRQAGDVSAVIEMPGGFLVFSLKEKPAEKLVVTSVSIPKRSYDEWLAEQPETGTD